MPARLFFYLLGTWLLGIALFARVAPSRKKHEGPNAWMGFFAAGMLFIIWGACGGFYSIFMFTDRIRAHRSLDPGAVVAFEVLPPDPEIYRPLVPQVFVITDRQRIRQAVRALTTGEPWLAAHPEVTWQCRLRVDDGTRKHSYLVSSTTNNGVLISVDGLGEYREDSLRELLEQIAAAEQD